MKKPCSEIGLWVSRVGARYLSQSMFFPYLYEKKMSNMHIENFKKSETFYNEPWLGRQGEADAFSH